MGGVCACQTVEKAQSAASPAGLEEEEGFDEEELEEGSEVCLSDEESDGDEAKQDVMDNLTTCSKGLKRGKTLAMKEAIGAAKAAGVDKKVVKEAEQVLDAHKKKQMQEEIIAEADTFFNGKDSKNTSTCKEIFKKAKDAGCSKELLLRLKEHLDMLTLTRKLEQDELVLVRQSLRTSCKDFVLACVKDAGRPMTLYALETGNKRQSVARIDTLLQTLTLTFDTGGADLVIPIGGSLKATSAMADTATCENKSFIALEESVREGMAVMRFADGGCQYISEISKKSRSEVVEAITLLSKIGPAEGSPR